MDSYLHQIIINLIEVDRHNGSIQRGALKDQTLPKILYFYVNKGKGRDLLPSNKPPLLFKVLLLFYTLPWNKYLSVLTTNRARLMHKHCVINIRWRWQIGLYLCTLVYHLHSWTPVATCHQLNDNLHVMLLNYKEITLLTIFQVHWYVKLVVF